MARITPSGHARELAVEVDKDPRLVEVILSESVRVVRKGKGVLIVEHRSGYIMANAGVDQSNVAPAAGVEPAPPEFEFGTLPAEHVMLMKVRMKCNWAQVLEGVIDSAHSNFLHSDAIKPVKNASAFALRRPSWDDKVTSPASAASTRRIAAGATSTLARLRKKVVPTTPPGI